MARNNVILEKPAAGEIVRYNVPEGDSARLSFEPEDISGLYLGENGELFISFVDGGQLQITNFAELTDDGNLLYLADGTLIDPALLTNSLEDGAQTLNDIQTAAGEASTPQTINKPGENTRQQIIMKDGQKYVCDFDPASAAHVEIDDDGAMILTFADGSQVVIENYEEVMAGDLPAELTLADGTVVESEDLLVTVTDIQPPADIPHGEAEPVAQNDLANQLNNIETAAGDDIAAQLNEIETAAGDTGASNSGFGFNSSPTDVPLNSPEAIGPLGPTRLSYTAPAFQTEVVLEDDEIPATPANSIPQISPARHVLDETNLAAANLSVAGTLNVDFGADGPGVILPSDRFAASDSVAGGTLSSNGVPVVVTSTADGYIGVAGGVTIFEFSIDPQTGDYTFIQYEQLDHADGTDPNDEIHLNFGVVAIDADEDSLETFIHIIVQDDAPTVLAQTPVSVDETTNGVLVANGQFNADVGQDVGGTYSATNTFSATGSVAGGSLTSNGSPVTVALSGNTYTGTDASGTVIFTLEVDTQTGAYTYTQYQALDHADGTDPNDVISLNFGMAITDYDGDSANGQITIDVYDDAPTIQTTTGTVDETDMNGASASVIGTISFDYGNDGGGFVGTTNNFTAGGSLAGGALTSNGLAVTVTQTPAGYEGVDSNGTVVFVLDIHPTNGDYVFTLYEPLDHADTNDHNDRISLDFGISITDFDNDSVPSNIVIYVDDDGPCIDDARNSTDESDMNGGSLVVSGTLNIDAGEDGLDSVGPSGNFNSTGSLLGGALTSNGVAVVVTPTATGYVGVAGGLTVFTVEIDAQTGDYVFTQNEPLDHADGSDPNDFIGLNFGVQVTDGDGDTDTGFIKVKVYDDAPVANDDYNQFDVSTGTATGNVILGINGGPGAADETSEDVLNTVTQVEAPDGTVVTVPATGTVQVQGEFGILTIAADGSYTYDLTTTGGTGGSASLDLVETDADGISSSITKDGITVTSNNGADLAWVDEEGPGVGVAGGSGGNKAFRDEELEVTFAQNVQNATITLGDMGPNNFNATFTYEVYLASDPTTPIIQTVFVDENLIQNGLFEFDVNALDFGPDAEIVRIDLGTDRNGPSFVLNDVDVEFVGKEICDEFIYTLQDGDGDTSTATLKLAGNPSPIDVGANSSVDETDLAANGRQIVDDGNITVNLGGDVLDRTEANDTFSSDVLLTSNGVPVLVTLTGNTYTGAANGVPVFTMVIHPDAQYTFTLLGDLDHPDATDPNDTILLNFGVNAIDTDGDIGSGNVTITVFDDAPDAVDDGNAALEGETVTGNVTDNDDEGADKAATVTAVEFNGVPVVVPPVGTVDVVGNFGTLTIDATGAYSYTANDNNPEGVDSFIYTLTDNDGDSDKAELSIEVAKINDIPVIRPAINEVDETDLHDTMVSQIVTGDFFVDFGNDGPGVTTAGGPGNFTAGGSLVGGVLTSDGNPITISMDDNTFVGRAGRTLVFTMEIKPDATYEFTLFRELDHADGTDPNDVITLDFGVVATDADGDTATTDIRINVLDDGPTADLVFNTVDETDLDDVGAQIVSGSFGADFGADGPGAVSASGVFSTNGSRPAGILSHDGTPVDVTLSGNTYTGTANGVVIFTMVINDDATYEFSLFEELDHADGTDPNDSIVLNFGTQITDGDGDTDTSFVRIRVFDDAPIAVDDGSNVVEGETITGNVTDNDDVGADKPGTVTQVQFSDFIVIVPSTGITTVNGNYGVLTIDATGAYSYTANSNNPQGVDEFTYTLEDNDGDTDRAVLSIEVDSKNDIPVISSDTKTVDETDLFADGPQTVGGDLNPNFFGDGPGTVTGNNVFSFGGSTNGELTHCGEPVVVEYDVQTSTYTGTAKGETVFTMVVSNDGQYEFTLYKTLDHADTNDHDDVINLNFGAIATDADGDTATSTITVNVKDDGPYINRDPGYAPESRLVTDGVIVVDGALPHSFGADGPGAISFNGLFKNLHFVGGPFETLRSNGVEVVTSNTDTTFTGTVNGETAFTMTLDPLTGEYVYKQYVAFDHPDPTSPDEVMWLKFYVDITDKDGDTDTSWISIDIHDDAPDAEDDKAYVKSTITHDEYCLDPDYNDVSGFQTSITNDGITVSSNNGKDLVWFSEPNLGSGIGIKDGNNKVYGAHEVLEVRFATAVTAAIFSIGDMGSNNIGSVFKYEVYLEGSTTPIVETVVVDAAMVNNGIFDFHVDGYGAEITGVNLVGGPSFVLNNVKAVNSTVEYTDASGNVLDNDYIGADEPGTVTQVEFNGQVYDVPETGYVTIQGDHGVLKMKADGSYTYEANDNASQTIYSFTKDYPNGSDGAGDIKQVSGSYNETTQEMNFSFVISGQDANGFTLVMNGGPNPKNHPGEMAMFYFDASNPGTPIVTMYGYNGANSFNSFMDGSSAPGVQTPDQIGTSFVLGDLFTDISVVPDGNGNQMFSFSMDASVVNDHVPLYTQNGVEWTGMAFGEDMGIWFHPVVLNNTAYDADGYLTEWDVQSQSWWDADYQTTDKTVIKTGGEDKFKYTVEDADGDMSMAWLEICIEKGHNPIIVTPPKKEIESFCLDPKHEDVCYFETELTKDGITISSNNGQDLTWVAGTKGTGVGIGGFDGNSKKIYGDDEYMIVTFDKAVDNATFSIADIGSHDDDKYFTYKVYVKGSATPITETVFMAASDVNSGIFEFTVDGYHDDITRVDLIGGSGSTKISFAVNNVKAEAYDYGVANEYFGTDASDAFLFQAIGESAVTIHDFHASEGDSLDLSALLQGYDDVTDAINEFVYATQDGSDTIISVDADGAANGSNPVEVARLEGVTGADVQDLLDNGNLIA